jgi:hypothetical protein
MGGLARPARCVLCLQYAGGAGRERVVALYASTPCQSFIQKHAVQAVKACNGTRLPIEV